MTKIRIFLEMIKFEHTVFALPFAYLGYWLGSRGHIVWAEVFWVTVIMMAARTAGMCLNRLIDRQLDAENPRTQTRALVTGVLSKVSVSAAVVVSLTALAIGVLQLNPLCGKLLPLAVLFLFAYHYLKRFTFLCHFGIGLVLACAPVGGWLAATGRWETAAGWLGLAVFFWVAGFDIIYSLQDEAFDRARGLQSLPAKVGASQAMAIAAVCHILTLIFLIGLGILQALTPLYWLGLVVAAVILTAEHFLIRLDRVKYVSAAFFTMNGFLSISFFVITLFSQTV